MGGGGGKTLAEIVFVAYYHGSRNDNLWMLASCSLPEPMQIPLTLVYTYQAMFNRPHTFA